MNNEPNRDNPADWLCATGPQRDLALRRAANYLLEDYLHQKRTPGHPINLYRLASLRRTKIVLVRNLSGKGRLLPVKGGFQVLISSGLPEAKFRASVAHELAHSLFYYTDTVVPTRLFPPGKAEHMFCMDAARHILGPSWLLEEVGVLTATHARVMFDLLTRRLRISRPLAARLLLSDYALRTGVGDRWSFDGADWRIEKGGSVVSPSISGPNKREREIRLWLRGIAKRVLEGHTNSPEIEIVSILEREHKSAFVVATIQRVPQTVVLESVPAAVVG